MSIETNIDDAVQSATTPSLSEVELAELAWQNSTLGQYLHKHEQALFDDAVVDLFGFNALQMGCAEMDLLRQSRIANRYKLSAFNFQSVNQALTTDLLCEDDFLPFAEMSVDLLLLPHRLEFSERPHQTLREASRILMPEGHLLISGFNPLSILGAKSACKKALSTSQKNYPWYGSFIGLARLKDWLNLLGFEIVTQKFCCHLPPCESAKWHQRFGVMDNFGKKYFTALGGVYFIVAKKRVVGMMPIKPNWKKTSLKSRLIVQTSQKDAEKSNQKPVQKTTKKRK